jgi:carbamoyl-phosphate synthase large subunit
VFPFVKFPGVDPLLGPEMKSTGEVMGVGRSFGEAFAKAQLGAGDQLPRGGQAFISVRDADKARAVDIARDLERLGFTLIATKGTPQPCVQTTGLRCETVHKVGEGRRTSWI